MAADSENPADTIKLVLGYFSSAWSPEIRSLVVEALPDEPESVDLLHELETDTWGSAREKIIERLSRRYLESDDIRGRFDAAAMKQRLLDESLELAQHAELALGIPNSAIRRTLTDVIGGITQAYPRVQTIVADFEANSDLSIVGRKFQTALGAVLFADADGRRKVADAVAHAGAASVVHRCRRGLAEWMTHYVGYAFREHEAALTAFEGLLANPDSDAVAEAFIETVAPLLAADPRLRVEILRPDGGGMGPGPGIDLEILEPDSADVVDRSADSDVGPLPGGLGSPAGEATAEEDAAPGNPPQEPSRYRAYPVLRPEGLAPGQSFNVSAGQRFRLEVGIGPTPDRELVALPRGIGEVAPGVHVVIQLVYDPLSFRIDAPRPIDLKVTADTRFPTQTVDVKVMPLDDPDVDNRRIAAHYYVDGELRAVVFRTFREAGALVSPTPPTSSMIDLTPLLGEDPPEVVFAIYSADSTAPGRHMMAIFPRSADIPPPEVMHAELDPSATDIMTQMYQLAGAELSSKSKVLLDLVGKGVAIGDAIPDSLLATLRAVAAVAEEGKAPRMLLLSEETRLPWELAAFGPDRPFTSFHGGNSPYLGAHFAIGRWPLSAARREQPVPRRDPVKVRKAGLVSAKYDGAEGWDPLEAAIQEVEDLKSAYGPAVVWPPILDEVLTNMSDDIDVIHFALHGQFLAGELEDGLVLLTKGSEGLQPTYLGPDTISGRAARQPPLFPASPFVFLNACQVGQGHRVLGDYAGLAVALLRAGARGVVACIWNVDDGIAGSISRDFYRRADNGESPAEILRAVRAQCDPTGDSNTAAPTLLAYQYFGHPNMHVQRVR